MDTGNRCKLNAMQLIQKALRRMFFISSLRPSVLITAIRIILYTMYNYTDDITQGTTGFVQSCVFLLYWT